jgi:hypothetical protein
MHRGFNLSDIGNTLFTDDSPPEFEWRGTQTIRADKTAVGNAIDSFANADGVLDGNELQRNWFPEIRAEVFISHSHQDARLAARIAGWLETTIGVKPFVDSSVWGHADSLLRKIDDRYCLNPGGETYSYNMRNGSTAHVHMMLSTALGMMIDDTECLIFLNTAQSINWRQATSRTLSPWLFAEIAMSRMIRKKTNPRIPAALADSHDKIAAGAKIDYQADLRHLTEIGEMDLLEWEADCEAGGLHPLDLLYKIAP